MITIVDYGLGNVQAFVNVFRSQNIDVRRAVSASELESATRLILPGVGAFDTAVERLRESGMRPVLDDLVCRQKIPVLGVCVGMQLMALASEEGSLPGLGWIQASVRKVSSKGGALRRLPHMGWNEVRPTRSSRLFNRLSKDGRFYFLHSYYVDCSDAEDVEAVTEYGESFCCAMRHENIYGVQFHPEKSHHNGTKLLLNFAADC